MRQLVTARGVPIADRRISAFWLAPSPEEEAYEHLETLTDSRGRFRFDNLAAGQWRVETQSPQSATTVAWITLEGTETREVVLREGATARWHPEFGRLTLRLTPGVYALRRLPPGGGIWATIGVLPVVATFAVAGDHPVELTLP